MGYCTISSVKNRNSLLLSNVDDDRIISKIDHASEIVDGKLRSKYPVPFSSLPALIKSITADLAASFLIAEIVGRRGDDAEPIQANELYKRAMDEIKDIQEGVTLLETATITRNLPQGRSTTYKVEPKFLNWNPARPSTFKDW